MSIDSDLFSSSSFPPSSLLQDEPQDDMLETHVGGTADLRKLSDYTASPIYTVIIGQDRAKNFHLHADLISKESDRLASSVSGGFLEQQTKEIHLQDEDPELFGYFIEFLYSKTWGGDSVKFDTEYVILARLYTLGDRLQACGFQSQVLNKFLRTFPTSVEFAHPDTLPMQHICELLDIVMTELPSRNSDELRKQVLWLARLHSGAILDHPCYSRLRKKHPGLVHTVRKEASLQKPHVFNETIGPRYLPESAFDD